MLLDLCLFIVLFTIPTDVVLSMWIGVGGWEWPSSWIIRRMIHASWVLIKSVPNSASAADAATIFSMVHVMAMLPLSLIFFPLRGMLPRKKYPLALLLPWDSVRYDESEWMLSTISDALNWMIAFGLVCIYCKRCWTCCIVCSVGLACSASMALRDNKIVRSTTIVGINEKCAQFCFSRRHSNKF